MTRCQLHKLICLANVARLHTCKYTHDLIWSHVSFLLAKCQISTVFSSPLVSTSWELSGYLAARRSIMLTLSACCGFFLRYSCLLQDGHLIVCLSELDFGWFQSRCPHTHCETRSQGGVPPSNPEVHSRLTSLLAAHHADSDQSCISIVFLLL